MKKEEKINIIYLLGAAHSGSTLIGNFFERFEDVHTLGEMANYMAFRDQKGHNKYNLKRKYNCTCGVTLDKCPFWSKVIGKDQGKFVIKKKYTFFENLMTIIRLFMPFRTKRKEKINSDYALFKILKHQTGAKYLFDISKDPRRLLDLYEDPRFNITVIYLVRDGRAYANSYNKKSRSDIGLKRKNFFVGLFEWIFINMISIRILKKYRLPYIHISYDLFCQEPKQYFNKFNEFMKFDDNIIELNNSSSPEIIHQISGNMYSIDNLQEIKYDQQWRIQQKTFNKIVGTFITALFNRIWVYRH